MADRVWTAAMVENRLSEAAEVLACLPEERVPGYFNTWPAVLQGFDDLVGQQPRRTRRPLPSPAAISRMEEALTWIRFLEADDGRLVWARAEGTPWKAICWRFGIARATAHRRWQYGLSAIAWRLKGRTVPAKRSRAFLVARASGASSRFGG